ncbi:MAG: hypothetical protein EBV19_06550 [Flavobacteriia bacterium]|nr:hypothetical protein [Flavobacteriia bacterium]
MFGGSSDSIGFCWARPCTNLVKITVIGRFIFGFIVLRSLSFIGQGTLTLLPGSEKVYYDKTTQTHRLVGTVSFTYQGNTMYCDSAFYKEKEKIVRAFGHVHITKDDIDLYCDSLFYSGTHKFRFR